MYYYFYKLFSFSFIRELVRRIATKEKKKKTDWSRLLTIMWKRSPQKKQWPLLCPFHQSIVRFVFNEYHCYGKVNRYCYGKVKRWTCLSVYQMKLRTQRNEFKINELKNENSQLFSLYYTITTLRSYTLWCSNNV